MTPTRRQRSTGPDRWEALRRRFALSVPVVVVATGVTFALVHLGPLDPVAAILGPGTVVPGTKRRIQRAVGVGRPIWVGYVVHLVDLLTLDLGRSWVIDRGTPVAALVADRAPRTTLLWGLSAVVAAAFALPAWGSAALAPGSSGDRLAAVGGVVRRATPTVWLAVVVAGAVAGSAAVGSPPGPSSAIPGAVVATVPAALVLGSAAAGHAVRSGREAVRAVARAGHVEVARAKGLPGDRLLGKHVLRNAAVRLVPTARRHAVLLFGGTTVVEVVFGRPGLGRLFFRAAIQGDLPMAATLLNLGVLALVGIAALQELCRGLVDPRGGDAVRG